MDRKKIPKIIILVLIILLIISVSILIYFSVRYVNIKKDNDMLSNNIADLNDKIANIDNNYGINKTELDKKKNELKDKIEEYELWLEMIEKVK